MKLNFDADNISDAMEYFNFRNKQLASIGIRQIDFHNYSDKALIVDYSNGYSSIYILNQFRGKGLYNEIIQKINKPIITMNDCNIVDYLVKNEIEHIVVKPSESYCLISNYYGDKTAKRSGLRLMNHIDEGLDILNSIGASQDVLDAYCLHPLLQSDDALRENIDMDFKNISTRVIILTMEYRRTANSFLSTMNVDNFVGFVNDEIKQMLFADKKQNEKDFKIYHEKTHKRSKELREYFDTWLNILLK